MSVSAPRPSPDELLRRLQAEEAYQQRGRLKIFLGYASGVGKSFRMFDEGRRRRERGQDVVIGAIQPKTPPELAELLKKLETIPLQTADGIPYMDVEAILVRHPQLCLVDGLAYDNPPGRPNAHRWQDVEQLLRAGIAVVTSVNLQYVQERREEVERIVASLGGKHVTVTVPESFLRTADEIEIVDAPAEYCMEQAAGAHIPLPELEHRLSQLREIALLLTADVVDQQLEDYVERHGVGQTFGTQERILVCMTPRANGRRMMERARLARDRFHGELFVVHVSQPNLDADAQAALERNLDLARHEGAGIRTLEGSDAIAAILQFAREQRITQIYVGHSPALSWWSRFRKTAADRLIEAAEGIDVKLIPQ
jgi:two-component system, OmpR family, sensor histidine kinase KdpD